MNSLTRGVCLALVGAGLVVVPSTLVQTAATAAATPPSPVQRITSVADGTVGVSTDPDTGDVRFVRTAGDEADLLPDVAGDSTAEATDKVAAYLDEFGPALGAPAGQLRRTAVTSDDLGWTISYTQTYRGVPVFGSGVKANVDKTGDLTSVAGFAVPDLDLSTTPRYDAATIGRRAVDFVRAEPATDDDGVPADTSGIKAVHSDLVVYRVGFIKGQPGESVLAWSVEVSNGANVRDMLVYDAQTGKILNRWSMMGDALNRELREASGTKAAPTFKTVWTEGDPLPGTLNQDQQNLVNSSGESYWFFKNAFDRDSYDGAGAKRITVNNDPRISCPNANWNGTTTNYCDGVTSDDVVAHEWGHAYTEYTSGLIYQYQPGALNESYSDVWGETLDQVNGREDEGETFGAKRPDDQCDPTAPAELQMSITAPASVAGACTAVAAAFGDAFTTTPVNATVVAALDAADATGPTTNDGCSTYTNAAAVAGSWAYVDRGTCGFQDKVRIAVAAGAKGVVIGNVAAGLPPAASGTAPAGFYGVTVTQADGTRFKTAGTSQVTVRAEDISVRTPSTRWLIGEKATAFGGAIRDMWTPTCYGNPGKVTDAEYNCDPLLTDAGGVHGNSGVPNHAYALAVDGGTYNGQSITGMGLDRAAAIRWRAQTAHLVESSNFADAADAFEQSCTDLVGQPIRKLTTAVNATAVAAAPVTAANCADLAKVMTAVQMRTPVTQCDFQPLLKPGRPAAACGPAFTTRTLFTEDFENGLAGWAASSELGDGGGRTIAWRASTAAPTHPGGVAFAADPVEGTCAGDGSRNDISSSNAITSQRITVPGGDYVSPLLTFDHYVATEAGFDGGNVKISVGSGPFVAVAPAAYTFNAPRTLATAAAGNTSPLAGQPGFTGTDGGEVKGSWGTSQIDLAQLGVQPGASVRVRFDMGRDGCGGLDGWYVDDVSVTACQRIVGTGTATSTAAVTPQPIVQGTTGSLTASVSAPSAAGPVPTGRITVAEGATILGAAELVAGVARVPLPSTLSVGTHPFTVTYSGDRSYAVSRTTATALVVAATDPPTPVPPLPTPVPTPVPTPGQATTGTKATSAGSVARGRTFAAKVRVSSTGAAATGLVIIKVDGRTVGTGTLAGGRARITLKTGRYAAGARVRFTATYAGSATAAGSKDTFRVTILRRQ